MTTAFQIAELLAGLEKNLNSSLPFEQAALKLYLPWARFSLFLFLFSWQMACLGSYPWVNENEKLLAQQENLLALDEQMTPFSSPVSYMFLVHGGKIQTSIIRTRGQTIYFYIILFNNSYYLFILNYLFVFHNVVQLVM